MSVSLESIAGKLYANGVEVLLATDVEDKTQIVDFGTITNNTRTVLANPFFDGLNDAEIATRCTVRAEIQVGGVWSETGFTDHNDIATKGYGTVGFSNLEGIVVQTGQTAVMYEYSARQGNGFGLTSTAVVTSAPCRVIVTLNAPLAVPENMIPKPEYIDSRSLATAWARFTVSTLESFNATIVNTSTGLYAITFATPMDTTDYSAVASGGNDGGHNRSTSVGNMSVNGFEVRVTDGSGALITVANMSILVHGGKNL